jgi:hypothetical protein
VDKKVIAMPDKDKSARLKAAKMRKTYDVVIGIDTGVNTGYALWRPGVKRLIFVDTVKIHTAMQMVKDAKVFDCLGNGEGVLVRGEDARKRQWFGNAGREQLQGAGSIKRDATIWEDFLTDLGVDFEMVAPKSNTTKVSAEYFAKITGWKGRTSEHARDAAMLCFGY